MNKMRIKEGRKEADNAESVLLNNHCSCSYPAEQHEYFRHF